MVTIPMNVVLAFLLLVIVLIVIILILQLFRSQRTMGNLSASLLSLTQSLQQGQTQIAVLAEKVAQVEQNQAITTQEISHLATGLAQTGADIASKVSTSEQQSANLLIKISTGLAGELAKLKEDLARLQASAEARQEMEKRTAESIRRLETILAGTQSKGSAGENIVDLVFSKLPPEWQVRGFTVRGKTVEFGLRLPNNLILPIDSKWTATDLLEQYIAAGDPGEQQRLKIEIERKVKQKASEVGKYIDPSVTVPFGVAVVPDAIFDLCAGVQAEIFGQNIVLVSYSMFVPYLLLVFQTILKTEQSIDLQKLDAYLQTAQKSLAALQEELDGRFSRAITMLNNSRDDMKVHIGEVSGSLTGLQISASAVERSPTLPEPLG